MIIGNNATQKDHAYRADEYSDIDERNPDEENPEGAAVGGNSSGGVAALLDTDGRDGSLPGLGYGVRYRPHQVSRFGGFRNPRFGHYVCESPGHVQSPANLPFHFILRWRGRQMSWISPVCKFSTFPSVCNALFLDVCELLNLIWRFVLRGTFSSIWTSGKPIGKTGMPFFFIDFGRNRIPLKEKILSTHVLHRKQVPVSKKFV